MLPLTTTTKWLQGQLNYYPPLIFPVKLNHFPLSAHILFTSVIALSHILIWQLLVHVASSKHYSRLSVAGDRNLIWTCLGKNMKVKLKISWVTHVIHKVHELQNFKDQRYTQIHPQKKTSTRDKMLILFQQKTLFLSVGGVSFSLWSVLR